MNFIQVPRSVSLLLVVLASWSSRIKRHVGDNREAVPPQYMKRGGWSSEAVEVQGQSRDTIEGALVF